MNEIAVLAESLWYLTLSILNITLCIVLCKVLGCVKKLLNHKEYERLLKLLIDSFNGILDVWQKGQETSNKVKSGGYSAFAGSKESRGDKKIPAIDELPPEVIAPNLKGMQKSSGFGTNKSKKASDT